jgi:endonuclease/exonuclease/phosphatase family metal-dependent hydrolase
VPAQVMLGIAAQESNLWQAPRFVLPGATGNPLIGNYFGLDIYNGTEADDWTIRWDKADCGYGVTQVTDGMRLAGREKPGETALPYQKQRAVALDFAANIAAGLQILQSKWNQTRSAGLVINNGDPAKLENWFFAVWAYNSGFHPNTGGGAPWGVGWANNPANPKYPANRTAFLDTTYQDAAHPQDWPYQEKVMGWAGHPVEVAESPTTLVSGYRAAWWNGGDVQGPINRRNVKPPLAQFCDATNQCVPGAQYVPNDPEVIGEPAGPCGHQNAAGRYDLQCWYHVPSTWKSDCDYSCGNELLRFDPGYAYQEDGTSYPPQCTLDGLPSNAQVIDDVPDGTPIVRPGCSKPGTNAGTFTFTFKPDGAGQFPGKIDTHQLGGGFGGHFWFSRTRTAGMHGGRLEVKATWRFNQTELGFGRVLVHLPDNRAQTRIARYVVKTAYGDRVSVVQQPGIGNRWVSIGVWRFGNRPEVSLSTVTPDGTGTQDVAFDAVAFVPIPQVETLEVLDWNIAGGVKNFGEFDVVERIVREVQERRPDIISLNEVCIQQFERLATRLTEIGYPMGGYFSAAQLLVPSCAEGIGDPRISNGNAVLVKAPVSRTQSYMFESTDPTIPDNTLVERTALPGESKGVACLTARFPNTFQDTKVCSTHLVARKSGEPNPYQEAEEETREMVRVFGTEARNMPFILAGDFNIKTLPDNAVLGTVYTAPTSSTDWTNSGNFKEVEQERQCVQTVPCDLAQGGQATHPQDGGEKIDYVFASRWYFTVPVGRVEIIQGAALGTCGADNHPCSDHFMMRSEVQLPPAVQH